jgi:hypothetical protein
VTQNSEKLLRELVQRERERREFWQGLWIIVGVLATALVIWWLGYEFGYKNAPRASAEPCRTQTIYAEPPYCVRTVDKSGKEIGFRCGDRYVIRGGTISGLTIYGAQQ